MLEVLATLALGYILMSGRVGEGQRAARLAGRWLGRASGTALKVRAEGARVAAAQAATNPSVKASSESLAQSVAQFRAVANDAVESIAFNAHSIQTDVLSRQPFRSPDTLTGGGEAPPQTIAEARYLDSRSAAIFGNSATPPPPPPRIIKATFEAVYDAGSSVPRAPSQSTSAAPTNFSNVSPGIQSMEVGAVPSTAANGVHLPPPPPLK